MTHPIRIRISVPPLTPEEVTKALRMRPSEMKVADALVKKRLASPRAPRKKKAVAVRASIKSA